MEKILEKKEHRYKDEVDSVDTTFYGIVTITIILFILNRLGLL